MCNNHLLDKGVEGLTSCMDYWDRLLQEHSDLLTYGVYRDVDDMNNIRIKEVNGLKVAFLAYTENINGYTVTCLSSSWYTKSKSATSLIRLMLKVCAETKFPIA